MCAVSATYRHQLITELLRKFFYDHMMRAESSSDAGNARGLAGARSSNARLIKRSHSRAGQGDAA